MMASTMMYVLGERMGGREGLDGVRADSHGVLPLGGQEPPRHDMEQFRNSDARNIFPVNTVILFYS